ncbi:hypothetical protein DDB_G0285519 [Dictyostelium discoideum AX4]|uniref:Uncharacterized protein n=1 Tax=Dictyostelium discoideum TaxID=44689 RepID=Q54N42_DICDI|nr:hypothetical protein DDB_G0285519 [Dictyostelium discoideum AX4]EAL64597.1 hypothetical protein DDB_G0285519 [Dictyostelium discoideum AX4]|eukprot:XP_638101.1 hypothetical protein DDB_G0285519 [Dictyostelium discoideum AX4]
MLKDSLLFLFHCPFFVLTSIGMAKFYSLFVSNGGVAGRTDPLIMLCFLTLWGQFFLIFFFGTSSIVDLLNIFKAKKNTPYYYLFLRVRDLIFRSIIFPIGIVITSLFWGIYHYDRELIFGKALDSWFPSYLNHLHHTLPGILIVIETLIVNHQYHPDPNTLRKFKERSSPISEIVPITSDLKQDVSYLVSFILFYIGIIAYTRFHLNFWVYPILAVIPIHSKIIFIFSSSCFGVSLYIIGRAINQKIWGGKSVFLPPSQQRQQQQRSTIPPSAQPQQSQKKSNIKKVQ